MLRRRSLFVLLLLVLLPLISQLVVMVQSAVPTATDQCRILLNTREAEFCPTYAPYMCSTALYCQETATSSCNSTGIPAAAGTACGIGQICVSGTCLASSTAPAYTCLYGDSVITQSMVSATVLLPNGVTQMMCEDFMAYIDDLNLSPFAYCANYTIRNACCDTCQRVYDQFSCRDVYPADCFTQGSTQCLNVSATIDLVSIYAACPRTCGLCTQSQLKCSNGLCQNGATCIDVAATDNLLIGFYCVCPTGYFGDYCQLKQPCSPNPCLYGGICLVVDAQTYSCRCQYGYAGINCSTIAITTISSTVCNANPCQNGGFCQALSATTYSCLCADGYIGVNCTNLNGCVIRPCLNSGTCVPGLAVYPYYNCTCATGFYGTHCQHSKVATTTRSTISPCFDKDSVWCPYFKANGLCSMTEALSNGYTVDQYCPVSCGSCGAILTTAPSGLCFDQNTTLCKLMSAYCYSGYTIDSLLVENFCQVTCKQTNCAGTTTAATTCTVSQCCDIAGSSYCAPLVAYCDSLVNVYPPPCRKACGQC